MKRRSGLVSNSSSSSFLLFLDKIPETREEVKETFFPDDTVFQNPYVWDDNDIKDWPIEEVVETLFLELKDQNPLTEEQIIQELCTGWLTEVQPDWDPWDRNHRTTEFPDKGTEEEQRLWREKNDSLYNKWKKERQMLAAKYRKTLPRSNVVLVVTFSDNEGTYYAALEHGDTFRNVSHIRISNH